MGGTAYSQINKALSCFDTYVAFRHGVLTATAYQKWIEREGQIWLSNTLTEDQINLSARFPGDNEDFVRRALSQCRALDIIPDDKYHEGSAQQFLANITSWNHKDRVTHIFPEEALLMFALVQNTRPRRAAYMGSYYGYWAIAAKMANPDLEMTLLDIDGSAMELAQENFERLGLAHSMSFTVDDAEKVAPTLENVDLLVLGATGPKSDVQEDYRDKAIYYPHLKAGLEILNPGGLIVVHSVILSNFTGGFFWEEKQNNYRKQYRKFLGLLNEYCVSIVLDSTEGTLVARKRAA